MKRKNEGYQQQTEDDRDSKEESRQKHNGIEGFKKGNSVGAKAQVGKN
jgi:hypothetical protein